MTAHAREGSAAALHLTLLALLVLAGASLALRFAHLGALSYPVALGIALMKALLVAVFFMEILVEKASIRFAFCASLTLISLLLSLMVLDILTRSAPPLTAPPGMAQRERG